MKRKLESYLIALTLTLLFAPSLFAQGMFKTRADYPAGDRPYSVFSIDLDGDGEKADIVDLTFTVDYLFGNAPVLLIVRRRPDEFFDSK